MASFLLMESWIQNDGSGALVGVINADTSATVINNGKIQGLVNLGTHAFSGFPLKVGSDLPAANESNYLANDNTGSVMGVLNADTSSTTLNNAKLGGPLVTALTGNNGITVANPSGVGGATLGLSNVPNGSLAGPLLNGLTAGTGITITGNPGSGTGSPTISASSTGSTVAKTTNIALTTTSATTVLTFTPTATGQFAVYLGLTVITAATPVQITVSWTDPASGAAVTETILPSGFSVPVGTFGLMPVSAIAASTASAITVSVTAGTANQAYFTGRIVQEI